MTQNNQPVKGLTYGVSVCTKLEVILLLSVTKRPHMLMDEHMPGLNPIVIMVIPQRT